MLFFLVGILASSTLVRSFSTYNYYELAVQKWCSSEYMIHGLWPQYNSTDYPVDCAVVSYTKPSGSLLISMNSLWSSCDDSLWQHEWSKHGSCMQEQINIDEDTFFNTTLSLFLDNIDDLDHCNDNDDCILACFDLDFKQIDCL
jgi:ribonuclease I